MTDPMAFEQWLRENQDLVDSEFESFENKIECEECAGTGFIELEEKDDPRFKQHMRKWYNEQKQADAKKLEDWNRIIHEETT